AFGGEDRLFTVDEEIALATRGQRHLLALERALGQQSDQTSPRIAHRVRLRSAARAPFLSAGTTGGGGPGRSSAAGARRGAPLPFATTGAGALRASVRAAGFASRAAAVRARPLP